MPLARTRHVATPTARDSGNLGWPGARLRGRAAFALGSPRALTGAARSPHPETAGSGFQPPARTEPGSLGPPLAPAPGPSFLTPQCGPRRWKRRQQRKELEAERWETRAVVPALIESCALSIEKGEDILSLEASELCPVRSLEVGEGRGELAGGEGRD